jgi:hypothetical protein
MRFGSQPAGYGRLWPGEPGLSGFAACSAAVGPIVVGGTTRGAITIARGMGRRHIGFVELGALSHIGVLTAVAVARLSSG